MPEFEVGDIVRVSGDYRTWQAYGECVIIKKGSVRPDGTVCKDGSENWIWIAPVDPDSKQYREEKKFGGFLPANLKLVNKCLK